MHIKFALILSVSLMVVGFNASSNQNDIESLQILSRRAVRFALLHSSVKIAVKQQQMQYEFFKKYTSFETSNQD